jgi:DNA-binding transcriptional LysR family regulator
VKHHRFLKGNRIVTFPFRRGRSQRSDSASSLITEVEAGRGVALALPMLKLVAGKRLLYRPLTGTSEVAAVGVAGATKGNVTPAGEKFCEVLRQTSISMNKSGMRGY